MTGHVHDRRRRLAATMTARRAREMLEMLRSLPDPLAPQGPPAPVVDLAAWRRRRRPR